MFKAGIQDVASSVAKCETTACDPAAVERPDFPVPSMVPTAITGFEVSEGYAVINHDRSICTNECFTYLLVGLQLPPVVLHSSLRIQLQQVDNANKKA